MRKIIWSHAAFCDLQTTFQFFSSDNPRHAHEWLEHLFGQVERLGRFPQIGRQIPELGKTLKYRQIVVGDYRIFHEVKDKEVFIFRILHSRQIFEA
ncbi:MAG: type II toxin-antitoxin system RelE/ParE family toxin [Candidatus Omnitrophica bacterium]|nr:type II toxin-antitoxin system RelE/ParE family toxin [Candidatus Omnitrophota bacterium]